MCNWSWLGRATQHSWERGASKSCHPGRAEDRVDMGQGGRGSVIATTNSAEQKGKTAIWSSWNKIKHERRLSFLIPVSQYSCVLERLCSTNTCRAHLSQESKPSKQLWTHSGCWKAHTDEQVGEIGRTNLSRCLGVEWSPMACKRGKQFWFICTTKLNKVWRICLGTGSWLSQLFRGVLLDLAQAHLRRILLDNGWAPFGDFTDQDWSQEAADEVNRPSQEGFNSSQPDSRAWPWLVY